MTTEVKLSFFSRIKEHYASGERYAIYRFGSRIRVFNKGSVDFLFRNNPVHIEDKDATTSVIYENKEFTADREYDVELKKGRFHSARVENITPWTLRRR